MNQHAARLFFLLLALPSASYAVLPELIRKVGPSITPRFMARNFATLSNEQRKLYEARRDQLRYDLREAEGRRSNLLILSGADFCQNVEKNAALQEDLKTKIFDLERAMRNNDLE